MNFKYVTIEREYGSGGTAVAQALSAATGIPCYGPEILQAVADQLHTTPQRIQQYEEKATGSFMYSLFVMSQAGSGNSNLLTGEGEVYVAEQQQIRRMAASGPAIFLGHCAATALKPFSGVLRVFIRCSDQNIKQQRIAHDYGIAPDQIAPTARYFDRKRANYFRANTGQRWDSLNNYDLILDTGVLGIQGCTAVLQSLLK